MNRFFRIIFTLALSFTYLFANFQIAQAFVVYDSHMEGGGFSANYAFGANWFSETFIASSNYTGTGVRLRVGMTGGYPDPAVNVRIRATTAGVPSGGDLATATFAGTYTHMDDQWNHAWEQWIFDTPYEFISGTRYAIIIECATGDSSNRPYVMTDGTGAIDEYPNGVNYRSTDSGATWPVNYPNDDMVFQITGESYAPIVTTGNVTDVLWNDFLGAYDATFNATLDNDGGEACQISWYHQVKDSDNWSIAIQSGNFTTGQSTNMTVYGQFELGTTYEYHAAATNSSNTSVGSILEFSPVLAAGIPVLLTYNYPIVLDTENLTARLYGRVVTDGTTNVTGYFYYREFGAGSWILSDNTTGLTTGTDYNILVTANLTLGKSYQFQAAGINDTGEGLGGIGSFDMAGLTQPAVTTLSADFIEDSQARISGNVTDLGNDGGLQSWFEWRKTGNHVWNTTSVTIMSNIGVYTETIAGLDSYENYEYRAVVLASLIGIDTEYTDYGDILTFNTMSTVQNPVMVTGNASYLSEGFVGLSSLVYFDGGSSVTVGSQYRVDGTVTWGNTDTTTGAVTNDTVLQFATGLINNTIYEYRAIGENEYGTGYGSIRKFYLTSENLTGGEDGSDPDTNDVVSFINTWRVSWGLTGVFGTWSFMGIILILVSLVFGIGMATVDTSAAKSAVAIAWLLSSVSIVGAFIFTGQLGIWPILILTGGMVVLILTVIGNKFTGGNDSG